MATGTINLPPGFVLDSPEPEQPAQSNIKLPAGFVLDAPTSQTGVKKDSNGAVIGPTPDLKTRMLNILPNVRPNAIPDAMKNQPQIVKDLETIPTNFLNQLSMNHLRSANNASGGQVPFEAQNSAINGAAKVAGVAGMVMSPLNKMAMMKFLGNGGKLGKAAAGAVAGAAYAPNDSPTDMVGRGIQAGTGALLSPVVSKLENLPENLRDASARLQNWMVKLPTKAFNYSKDPMAVFAKENVTGNSITDLAENYANRLKQRTAELDSAVQDHPATVDISKAVDSNLELAASKAKGSLKDRTGNLNELQTVRDSIEKQYGDLSKISIRDAIRLKRQLADDFPFTQETANDVNTKAAHKAYHDINAAVEKAAPEIKDLNQRVSGLIDISRAAKNRMAVEARNNPLGLIQSLIGIGTGSAVGGVEGAAAGLGTALVAKAISSPAVLSRVAKGLSVMADADKMAIFKAYPEFKNIAMAAMQGKAPGKPVNQPVLGLPAPEPPLPQYLQERQNIPPIQTGAGEVNYSNAIPMRGQKAPLEIPAPKVQAKVGPKPDLPGNKANPMSVKAPPADYLQQREIIPPLPKATGEAVSSNPIPLRGASQKATTNQTNPAINKPVTTLQDLMTKDLNKEGLKKKVFGAGVASLTALGASTQANAAEKAPLNEQNVVRTLIGEAEAEGPDSMNAHASAIRNRNTLKGAYGLNAVTYRDGKYFRKTKKGEYQISPKIVDQAKQAWQKSGGADSSGGANHWFSESDLKTAKVQNMVKKMKLVKKIGGTSFFKEG